MQFRGPEANIAAAVAKLATGKQTGTPSTTPNTMPAWQQALQAARLPLYDVHWTPAVVVDKGGKRGDGAIHVGLPDGRVVPLTTYTYAIRRA